MREIRILKKIPSVKKRSNISEKLVVAFMVMFLIALLFI